MADIIFDQTPFASGDLDASDPVAIANLQVTNYVAQENSQRKARYLTKYASYVSNMASGQPIPESRRVAPVPEMAQTLSAPDVQGYIRAVESNIPVVPQQQDVFYHGITIAEQNAAKAPDVTDIGKQFAPGWFQAGPNDTRPGGFKVTIPGPDGNMITLQKLTTPWGNKYEQVG